jgi:hypothetical protein
VAGKIFLTLVAPPEPPDGRAAIAPLSRMRWDENEKMKSEGVAREPIFVGAYLSDIK